MSTCKKALMGVVAVLCVVCAFASEGLLRDVKYAESESCKLDLKWPQGQTNFPTVVWLHGGGLTGGEKHFIGISESMRLPLPGLSTTSPNTAAIRRRFMSRA